jgi:hypothetical protein
MEKEDALKFLELHQPMPPDEEIDNELIEKYDDVRKYFLENKDIRCIPLFLNSFGFINGLGVYQLVEDVITMYEERDVIPSLIKSLSSNYYSVRYWNAQIASNFFSEELIEPLSKLLNEKDYDIKFASLVAIEMNNSPKRKMILEKYLSEERDEELQNMARNIMDSIN